MTSDERDDGMPARDPAACLPVLSQAQLNDPATVRQLREAGPVHHISVGGWHDSWVLTGYDVTMQVLADARLMGDADATGEGPDPEAVASAALLSEEDLVNLPGPLHARLRRLIGRQLTPRRVDALAPRVQAEVDRLLAAVEPTRVVDFVAAVALPLPAVVLCELFDIPADGRGLIYSYIPGMTSDAAGPVGDTGSPLERKDATMLAMAQYLRGLIERRRTEPGDDLISAMIHTPGAPPSDADLLSAVRLVLVSGHRAVTALVANGLLVLLQDREHWERLVREPALVDSAVEELLRYVTPIALSVPRYANCPIEVGGVVIPNGEIIQAAWGAANRDPMRVQDPDRLDLARSSNGHLSFGHGHHYCPGAPLGRLEASIVLRTLVDRFPRIRLAADQPAGFRTGSVRELVRLPVLLEPGAGAG